MSRKRKKERKGERGGGGGGLARSGKSVKIIRVGAPSVTPTGARGGK